MTSTRPTVHWHTSSPPEANYHVARQHPRSWQTPLPWPSHAPAGNERCMPSSARSHLTRPRTNSSHTPRKRATGHSVQTRRPESPYRVWNSGDPTSPQRNQTGSHSSLALISMPRWGFRRRKHGNSPPNTRSAWPAHDIRDPQMHSSAGSRANSRTIRSLPYLRSMNLWTCPSASPSPWTSYPTADTATASTIPLCSRSATPPTYVLTN
mmetsp:Transcript_23640/g.32285  ORF Transcript_23640/g.32285 Transcript_23640/m.32285 type:complete len:209 (-) Transcript_23640:4001-4627(-)